MRHVVFADPMHAAARRLGADALEQLGYAAESATWRNAYLLGAAELRQDRLRGLARTPVSPDVVRAMDLELLFDYMAVRFDADRADGMRLVLNCEVSDPARTYVLTLDHCALTYLAERQSDAADATLRLDRATLTRVVLRETTLADAIAEGSARVDGDASRVAALFDLLDDFALMFPVVEPRRGAG